MAHEPLHEENQQETYARKEHNEYISSAFKLASEFAKTGQPVEKTLAYLLQNETDILKNENDED